MTGNISPYKSANEKIRLQRTDFCQAPRCKERIVWYETVPRRGRYATAEPYSPRFKLCAQCTAEEYMERGIVVRRTGRKR